jgi:hypothetical protein
MRGGPLSYVTVNPAEGAFDRMVGRLNAMEDRRQASEVDRALREGLRSVYAAAPESGAATAATPTPAAPGSLPPPVPITSPPTTGSAPAGGGGGQDLAMMESGGRLDAVNPSGHAGRIQWSVPRLVDLGLYAPAEGERIWIDEGGRRRAANEWRGSFTIGGAPDVRTFEQFLRSPRAQAAAEQLHYADIERAIASTPGAENFDRRGLIAVANLGGVDGMRRFVSSGGLYDPADANGTRLSDWYRRASGQAVPGTQQPPSAAQAQGTAGAMPLGLAGVQASALPQSGIGSLPLVSRRWSPLIERLAATPGGGRIALEMARNAEQLDRTRTTRGAVVGPEGLTQAQMFQAQRLAMQALGRGDMEVFRYWAQRGNLNIPPQMIADGESRQRLARGALLAQRFYANNPDQAMVFFEEFLRTGDPVGAAQAAGRPRGRDANPNFSYEWVRAGDQELRMAFDRNNPSTPGRVLTGPDGQPVSRPVEQRPQRGVVNPSTFFATLNAINREYTDLQTARRTGGLTQDEYVDQQMRERIGPNWRELQRRFTDLNQGGAAAPPAPAQASPATPPAAEPAPPPTANPLQEATPPPSVRQSLPETVHIPNRGTARLTNDRTPDGRPVYVLPDGTRIAPRAVTP